MFEEVPKGYKKTEVGILPEEWDLEVVENIASITTGGKNTQDKVDDGIFPFFVRSQTIERINSYSFDGEAVLTAGDGVGTGKVFHYINGKFDVHQRVYRISEFSPRVSGYFFFLYFSSNFYGRIMQMTAKSSVDSVRREMISRMLVPVPRKITEQRAIATALSDIDALIAALDQLIAKKRALKKAALQQLLTGRKRLPGFETKQGYKKSEVGKLPGDWEVKRLGNLIHSVEYGSSSKSNAQGKVPVLRMGNIQDGLIDWADLVFTSDDYEISRYLLRNGDVLFNRTNTIDLVGKTAIYRGDKPAIFAGYLIRININPSLLDPNYLNFILNTEFSKKYGTQVLSIAVGQANINGQKLKSYPIPLPPTKSEQEAIAKVIVDMDSELAALEQRRDKTRLLKQGMMQQLLTGRIRLVDPAVSAPSQPVEPRTKSYATG